MNVSAPLLHFFVERYEAAFNAENGSFVDTVETGAPVDVAFADGRLALVLADAAFESAAERRTVASPKSFSRDHGARGQVWRRSRT